MSPNGRARRIRPLPVAGFCPNFNMLFSRSDRPEKILLKFLGDSTHLFSKLVLVLIINT